MAFWALARWLLHGNACVLLAVCSASALLCSRLELKYNAIFFLILLVMLQVSPGKEFIVYLKEQRSLI